MLEETKAGTADDGEGGVVKLGGELGADIFGGLSGFGEDACGRRMVCRHCVDERGVGDTVEDWEGGVSWMPWCLRR
jgi:hypothetical protein